MTTLITGAGLIGRLTAEHLREQGDTVVLVDIRADAESMDVSISQRANAIRVTQCDVTDLERLAELVETHHVTSIIHTAALLSSAIRRDPLAGIRVNTIGSANVLEVARRHGIRRVVLASSTTVAYSAFGTLAAEPVAEDFVSHSVSEAPASIYAATKIASEHLALAYANLYGIDAIVLRYGAVLGSGPEASTSVPGRLLGQLLEAGRAGQPTRLDDPILLWGGREEFVDARDCARANIAALQASTPRQRVFNVATGDWFTVDEFVATVRAQYPALHVEAMHLPNGGFAAFPHRRPAPSDVRAARDSLGFTAQYSLADSIAHFAARMEQLRTVAGS